MPSPKRLYSDAERKARAAARAKAKYHADKEHREAKKAYLAKYRAENRSKVLDCKRKSRIKHIDTESAYQKANRGLYREALKKFNQKNPTKLRAWTLVRAALVAGKLKKEPCQVCGCEKVEGHHHDYSKPLEVAWLCKKHHAELHRLLKKGRIGRSASSSIPSFK